LGGLGVGRRGQRGPRGHRRGSGGAPAPRRPPPPAPRPRRRPPKPHPWSLRAHARARPRRGAARRGARPGRQAARPAGARSGPRAPRPPGCMVRAADARRCPGRGPRPADAASPCLLVGIAIRPAARPSRCDAPAHAQWGRAARGAPRRLRRPGPPSSAPCTCSRPATGFVRCAGVYMAPRCRPVAGRAAARAACGPHVRPRAGRRAGRGYRSRCAPPMRGGLERARGLGGNYVHGRHPGVRVRSTGARVHRCLSSAAGGTMSGRRARPVMVVMARA
jgi:hypothetical protein